MTTGARKVARVGLDGSVRTVAEGLSGSGLDRPYTGGGYSVARDGASPSPAAAPSVRPTSRWCAAARSGPSPASTPNCSTARGSARSATSAPTSVDNRQIDAWLTLPPSRTEGQRVPLILEIHGGPFAAYGPHFSTDNQLYAAAGYAVLSVNPRGSTSYGEEFANLIHHAYPGRDYDDLMAAVDAAIAGGYADPDKLFVTGGSGGGVLTAWIVGKTDRFKAAATQKPVIDWTSFALTADGPPSSRATGSANIRGRITRPSGARSPLSLVGNVKTPTLVVVGSQDYRTPVSEAEQYYTALQLRGVPTALVKVPGPAMAASPRGRRRPRRRRRRSWPGSRSIRTGRRRQVAKAGIPGGGRGLHRPGAPAFAGATGSTPPVSPSCRRARPGPGAGLRRSRGRSSPRRSRPGIPGRARCR
jgi:acetyl esterase/lipase